MNGRPATDAEGRRLGAPYADDLLGRPPEPDLVDLTGLAAEICAAPIALISLVDRERLRFVSRVGLTLTETPRDGSFCALALESSELLVVEDAARDQRFSANPLVTGEPGVRFYAGAPLIGSEGEALGTLCVLDRAPRQLSEVQRRAMRVLSRQVMVRFELDRRTSELEGQKALLRASESRFDTLFRRAAFAAVLWRLSDGVILDVNRAWERLYGIPRSRAVGRTNLELEINLDSRRRTENLELLRRGDTLPLFELPTRLPSGEERTLLASIDSLEIDGELCGLATAQDITPRKRAEAKLAESEARLREATRAADVGLWDWNLADNTVWFSPEWKRQIGYQEDEISGSFEEWRSRVHPDDLEGALARAQAYIEKPWPGYENEFRFRHKDGTYRWILARASLERGADGRPVRMRGSHVDITERKQTELHVRQLNRTYAVLSAINQLIVREREPAAILDGTCRIAVETGEFRLAWVALTSDESGALEIAAHAGAGPRTLALLENVLHDARHECAFTVHAEATGTPGVCNDIAKDPAVGTWRQAALDRGYRSMASLPLSVTGRVAGTFNLYAGSAGFFDADELRLLDELAADLSYALDVCEREKARQRALERLRASEERLRELAETIEDVFWIAEPDAGRTIYVSPAYERIWGRSCASLLAVPDGWSASVHALDRERVQRAARERQTTGEYDEEYRIVRPDGETRWIRDRAYPVRDADGKVVRLVGVARDQTQRRLLEEQLRQSQKLDAIGQLAGGVAHDFNNILASILLQTESTLELGELPEAVRAGLDQVRADAERAARLTRQLLLFSRRQVLQPEDLDLNEVVASLAGMLRRIIGEDIHLELHLHPRPLPTRCDSGMLQQVLLNLAVNARDAMAGGGTLRIETSARTIRRGEPAESAAAEPGGYVCVRVTDSGTGIAPESLPHIFEPFYTTKEPGKGTGLGLATVFGIVRQHGGFLAVDSEPGRGSTFAVHLPAAAAVAPAPAAVAPPKPRGGSETILLVEDDAALRKLTCLVLERSGYRVLAAEHGVEALAIRERHEGKIHLLLTDIVLPEGLSGRELAVRLRADDPELRVVFTSGYSVEIAGKELVLSSGQEFLQKPAPSHRLLETVRRCLDG